MSRTTFLARLREGLAGLSPQEIDEIVADYDTHFVEGLKTGRSEDDIAAALGDPLRLAKELRAETGLRRWQERRNPGNFARVVFAFLGLATVDLIFLLPLMFVVTMMMFCFGVVAFAFIVAGCALIVGMFGAGLFVGAVSSTALGLTGVGLIAAGIAGGALLLLVLDVVVRLLGQYGRLHYRLLNSNE